MRSVSVPNRWLKVAYAFRTPCSSATPSTTPVTETGYGIGLSAPIAAVVPSLVDAILRELAKE
jgi:hypothetical protein